MSLKRSVLRSSFWIMLGNAGQHIVSFTVFIYLARILSPADFGMVALSVVAVELTAFIARMGQVELLQQKKELTDETINTSFWILCTLGAVGTIGLGGVALVLNHLPGRDLYALILALLAPICLMHTISAVPEAVFKRRLTLRAFAVRNIAAALCGAAVALLFVSLDYGIFALVAQRLSTAGIQCVSVWIQLRWVPRFRIGDGDIPGSLKRGGAIMLAGSMLQLNARSADILTGAFLGPQHLGYLRMAWRFFEVAAQLLIQPVSSVALSAFGRLQDSSRALGQAYLRVTQFVALAAFPAFFGLAAIADVLIPFVFGEKWTHSIPLVRLLPFLIVAGSVNYFFSPLIVAIGRNRILLRQSAIQLILTIVFLAVGAQWGVIGVMAGFIIRALCISIYNLAILQREIGLDLRAILAHMLPPLFSSFAMLLLILALKAEILPFMDPLPLLALLIASGACAYILVLWMGDVIGLWSRHFYDSTSFLADSLRRKEKAG